MISAILSFLGGSVFRMLWGEISSWIDKKLEHEQEMERMKLQSDLDDKRHAREQEAIKTQAEMNIQVIRVQGEQAVNEVEASAWLEAVKATGRPTGIKWVDAWNAAIRPLVASWAIVMLSAEAFKLMTLTEATASVCFAALGLYLADRALAKRGK